MQRIAASLTVLVAAWLGVSPALRAQSTGAVAGRLVDAGGRALGEATMQLFAAEGGQPVGSAVQTGATDAQGAWTFSGVTPGEYVVRAVRGAAVVGVPVTVGAALSSGVVIVAPSVTAAAAAGAGAQGGDLVVEEDDDDGLTWLAIAAGGAALFFFRADQS